MKGVELTDFLGKFSFQFLIWYDSEWKKLNEHCYSALL